MGSLPLTPLLTEADKQNIEYVAEYVGDSSNDWFTVKKELINCFPRPQRKKFSRRHYSTKLFFINDFERAIIDYWCKITGIELIIDKTKLHPESWERQPRGWGLLIYNEKRKKRKAST
jgi:hypothetical protein